MALTPDVSLLFAVTATIGSQLNPQLNIVTNPARPAPDPTSTAVTCSPGTAAIGQAVTCTATVTDTASSGATTPTGTVAFGSTVSGGSFSAGFLNALPGGHQRAGLVLGQLHHPAGTWLRDDHRHLQR